jgi:hypothetical protein
MAVAIGMVADALRHWLGSNRTTRICGSDFRPLSSPHLVGAPLCIQKGQGMVVFLEQVPQGHTWLLKLFTPGRRPTDDYLRGVERCLPGSRAFVACTQRRLLTREHLDLRASAYQNPALIDFVAGGILMPKALGIAWGLMADDLREGTRQIPLSRRLELSLALAHCIELLEAAWCSHRDLSATNVFVDEQGGVCLIDFDCVYHPDLPFQVNTTVGTLGYVAPFLKATGGHPDPMASWCYGADRFSLAVLVTELLLTGPALGQPQEDGALFSQAQIDEPGNYFVREIIDRLHGLSKPCGLLLERAFGSATFQECPSPQEWIGALRGMLRGTQGCPETGDQSAGRRRFLWVRCAVCDEAFSLAQARYDELQQKGKPILCRRCLGRHWSALSRAHAQQDLDFPKVSCEHCQRTFALPRQKLDHLRQRGRPLLCPACLGRQLERWRSEQAAYNLSHPLVACATCGQCFRLPRERLDQLTSKGKAVLCRRCLTDVREEGHATHSTPLIKTTLHNLNTWPW